MVLLSFAIALLHSLRAGFRSQSEQALVELALSQQLAVYAHARRRPRLTSLDRAFRSYSIEAGPAGGTR
jgi:hypothetical protein